jgi:hypothetical protein
MTQLQGLISRRMNKQRRLVYEVFENERLIKVYRMWTHYEECSHHILADSVENCREQRIKKR